MVPTRQAAPESAPRMTPGARSVLDAASTLFAERGLNAVGVDTIAAEAGVTTKTIYDRFGSKAQLVALYLSERDERFRAWVDTRIAPEEGIDRPLAIFDALESWTRTHSPRGCAFVHAHAELLTEPEHPAHAVIEAEKEWVRARFSGLVAELGCADPEVLAVQLLALHEGATVLHATTPIPEAARRCRDAAEVLIRAAL